MVKISPIKTHISMSNHYYFPDMPISIDEGKKYVGGWLSAFNVGEALAFRWQHGSFSENPLRSDLSKLFNFVLDDDRSTLKPGAHNNPGKQLDNFISCTSVINLDDFYQHLFLYVESHQDLDGNSYNTSNGFPVYARICYARARDYLVVRRKHTKEYHTGHPHRTNNLSPILEHWQSEYEVIQKGQVLNGVYGLGTPSIIKDGEYLYCFYTRYCAVNNNLFNPEKSNFPNFGYQPFISNIILPRNLMFLDPNRAAYSREKVEAWQREIQKNFAPTICVARAKISDIQSKSYENHLNPWKKFYRKPKKINNELYSGRPEWNGMKWEWEYEPYWDDTWEQPGIGGLDTSVIPDGETMYTAKVAWCDYLNRYVMVGHNEKRQIQMCFSEGRDLLKWSKPKLLDLNEPKWSTAYPCLIAYRGTIDQRIEGNNGCWLFFTSGLNREMNISERRFTRVYITFEESERWYD